MPRVLNSGEISQKVSSVHFWGIIRFIPQAVRFIVGIIHQKAVLRSLRSPETPFLAPFRLNLMRIKKKKNFNQHFLLTAIVSRNVLRPVFYSVLQKHLPGPLLNRLRRFRKLLCCIIACKFEICVSA